jgi:putative nucleotidyltransferase with HDIG domain
MARFNRHSASVAILSDLMAERLPVTYAEGAFVAGLLHDIGRLLIAMGLPVEFGRMLHLYTHTDHPWVQCERETLGFTHAELSAEALSAWKLPEPIREAVRDHHDPGPFQEGGPFPLSRVLDAANRYVNSMGECILTQQKNDAPGAAWIVSFGLTSESVEQLLADFDAEHTAMSQFFG